MQAHGNLCKLMELQVSSGGVPQFVRKYLSRTRLRRTKINITTLSRTDNIQNQPDNQAKEVNSMCSRIRKKIRRTEKKQKYDPEAHPMILLCIRKAAERIFSTR